MSEIVENENTAPSQGKVDVFQDVAPEVKIRTKKMMMYIIIFAIVMMFGGITSALIVMYGKIIWLHLDPPSWLIASNIIIIISSLTIWAATRALKSGKQQMALILTSITLALGLGFAISQNAAWTEMSDRGMGFTVTQNEEGQKYYRWNTLSRITGEYGSDYWFEMDNERLIYQDGNFYKPSNPGKPVTDAVAPTFNASGALISVLIYLHILHLILGLIYLIINIIRIARNRLNESNWISLHVNSMYWHFLGILWLYLFAFLFYMF